MNTIDGTVHCQYCVRSFPVRLEAGGVAAAKAQFDEHEKWCSRQVPCPHCGAPTRRPCRTASGRRTPFTEDHAERRMAVRALHAKGRK